MSGGRCNASSEHSPERRCGLAFDGLINQGEQSSSWASAGEGVGAWIQIVFPQGKRALVTKVRIMQRWYKGELEFGLGEALGGIDTF